MTGKILIKCDLVCPHGASYRRFFVFFLPLVPWTAPSSRDPFTGLPSCRAAA